MAFDDEPEEDLHDRCSHEVDRLEKAAEAREKFIHDLTRCAEDLISARKCSMCPDQGWFQMETGGCDQDGENDTRESVQMQCEWCHTNSDSFFQAVCRYRALFPSAEVKNA